jgi:rsbT antagonist protein RsbS
MPTGNIPRIPLQVSRQCIVASIQVDLSEDVLPQFRRELLALLHSSGAGGVILDVSGLDVIDHEDFEALTRTMAMAEVMGARTIICGLGAGVVASLVELGVQTADIEAAFNLDEAFRLMDQLRSDPPEEGEETGANEEDPDEPPEAPPADRL